MSEPLLESFLGSSLTLRLLREGRYSLRLMYDWSSYRLSTVVAIPILLSLAIGFWYMHGGGDVVTAWTIALYIVTAAAGKFEDF